ncbi:MAG: hypothetical protein R2769_04600 [Saprospiraceae bacterium]
MKFFFSWFVLSFIIGCSNSKIIKIEEPILPKTYDEIMVPQERYLSNSQNKNRKLRSGLVEFQGNEKFKLCFEDANLNGSFFDFGIDKVGLAFEADSFVLISQMLNPKIYFSAGNLLKNDQVFSVNKQPYKIVKFDNASSSVKVRKLKQNNKEFDFLLDRQFPDFSYRIENQVYGQIL